MARSKKSPQPPRTEETREEVRRRKIAEFAVKDCKEARAQAQRAKNYTGNTGGAVLPRTEIAERLNTGSYGGNDAVPMTNMGGLALEHVFVDPLSAHRLVSKADLINFINPLLALGKYEWEIYGGERGEDEIVDELDRRRLAEKIEPITLRERISFGVCDLADAVTFISLETGESIETVIDRLFRTANEPREHCNRATLGKPRLTRVQERGRKNRRFNDRCDRHRGNWRIETGRDTRRLSARSRKEGWLELNDWGDLAVELDIQEQLQLEHEQFWLEVEDFDDQEWSRLLDPYEEDECMANMEYLAVQAGTVFTEDDSTEPDSGEIAIRRFPPEMPAHYYA